MLALREYIDDHYKEQVNTHKQYTNQYFKLNDLCSQINTNKDVPCETFINLIKDSDYKTTTKLQLLNVALMFKRKIQDNTEDEVKPMIDFRDVLRGNETTERHNKNKDLIQNLPTSAQLTKYMNTQYKNENWKGFITNYILINFYTRNLDLNVIIHSDNEVIDYEEDNHIVIDDNKVLYFRNNYKTKNIYGRQKHIIKNVKFVESVKNHYNKHTEEFGNNVPLFINSKNEKVSDRDVGWYVAKETFNNIGEGNYLKVILQNINNKPNTMTKLEKVSSLRGTKTERLVKDYNLKSIT
tara:strand:+ start:1688 stop:2575 length:888 start_codon:yes stop_codon:yes gene_type:complete